MPAEEKARWCSGCAKSHPGAKDVANKKCEGCKLKMPNFGTPAEKKRRWCSACAPEGCVDLVNKKCETCGGPRAR